MSAVLKSLADSTATQYGIPTSIFASMIQQESSWNPAALGKAGEVGLGQLMPKTAKSMGINPWIPADNLKGSAMFLSDLYKKYGNWRDALSHYNAGFNLTAGRGYADKILGKAGYAVGSTDSQTPVLDAIKDGKNPLDVPGVGSLPGGDKSVDKSTGVVIAAENKDNAMGTAKEYFAKFGLWALAGFLIIIGVWRVVVK